MPSFNVLNLFGWLKGGVTTPVSAADPMPVSGPLTDDQLRLAPVEINIASDRQTIADLSGSFVIGASATVNTPWVTEEGFNWLLSNCEIGASNRILVTVEETSATNPGAPGPNDVMRILPVTINGSLVGGQATFSFGAPLELTNVRLKFTDLTGSGGTIKIVSRKQGVYPESSMIPAGSQVDPRTKVKPVKAIFSGLSDVAGAGYQDGKVTSNGSLYIVPGARIDQVAGRTRPVVVTEGRTASGVAYTVPSGKKLVCHNVSGSITNSAANTAGRFRVRDGLAGELKYSFGLRASGGVAGLESGSFRDDSDLPKIFLTNVYIEIVSGTLNVDAIFDAYLEDL
ncbi:MAG TPA: hypothetical protein VFV43_09205 [Limnobacter sp.]|nr:hypothetical protein [Limnobacter sp.]